MMYVHFKGCLGMETHVVMLYSKAFESMSYRVSAQLC